VTDPRIGTTLDGRYQIVGALASGGMGVVYRGERLGLGRSVAIKFLHAHMAADKSFLQRFAIEAKAMARLQHPHCAAVIDFGVEGQEPYVVMDLVAGESLRSLLDRGRLPPWRALGIMRQVLSGLAHAHEQGITHRDMKPDNIMVATGSFGDQVRILDFGLAKLRENTSGLTTGFVVGTPSYMAPEQTLAQPVDERTDIYSCGVVLFEMLTGAKPFRAEESAHVLRMHRETPPPRLANVAPDARLSDALEAAVLQAMAKAPSHRFASAAAFATALEHVPEAATRPGSAPYVNTPPPELMPGAGATLGTAPTEWSHPQQDAAQPAHRAEPGQRPETGHRAELGQRPETGHRAEPGQRPHATEDLGPSQIDVVVSEVAPPRAATENLGNSQISAFAAALADSGLRRSAAAPVPGATHGPVVTHGATYDSDPAFSVPGRALTPLPEAYPTGADTGFPGTRPDTRLDTELPSARRRSGLMTPYTEPSIGLPAHAQARKRRLWLGAGFGAAAVIALVAVGLSAGDGSEPVVTGDPLAGTAGPDGAGPVVELTGNPELLEPGDDEDDPANGAGDPDHGAGDPDEMGMAGVDGDGATPGEQTGVAQQDGSGATDPARLGVKTANQVLPPSLARAQALMDQGRTRQAIDLLQKLRPQDRENPQLHFMLGKAYFKELWVGDGLESFREAIALDPSYRSNRDLIETAAWGLANDSQHYAVSRFLVNDIGAAARPALEKVATGHHRDDVRNRAARALAQIDRLQR
jgi:serine/threonine protein kinase